MTTYRRRAPADALPSGLLFFLVRGRLPDPGDGIPHGFGNGVWTAFELRGDLLHGRYRPEARQRALERLQALWDVHQHQIEAATPEGERPWVLRALRQEDC